MAVRGGYASGLSAQPITGQRHPLVDAVKQAGQQAADQVLSTTGRTGKNDTTNRVVPYLVGNGDHAG